jgi:hypothetical protein
MDLALMVLAPFPIGWFVRDRRTAYTAYIALMSFVFTFQTGYLVIEWVGGKTNAFGPYPKANHGDVFGYGVVNLAIYAVGMGLLTLAYRLRSRRRAQGAERSTSPHSYASTTA